MHPTATGKKVLLAMSGGVDSSVAAILLRQQGYHVVGCFMRLGTEDSLEPDTSTHLSSSDSSCHTSSSSSSACNTKPGKSNHQGCCSINDAADARMVAALLDIPFYVLNFRADFGRIIDYFISEYHLGRTPNPCVRCNDWLKFGKLHSYARSIDADFVATGHYARISHNPNHTPSSRLLRGLDTSKDQSYVLFGTPQQRLASMLLPIGELTKPQVRQIAQQHNLPVFDKPDSQEICFVPDNDYASLIARRSPDSMKPGDILDTTGQIVGQHAGHQHFTIGQRRGVGVALGYPIYVVSKNAADNTVTVGPKESLYSTGLLAHQTNWLINNLPTPDHPRPCQVKIRYNTPPVPAQFWTSSPDSLTVIFDQPQLSVSPGQAVVCYDQDHLLGGGWIDSPIPPHPTAKSQYHTSHG